ncbi:MAG: recombinase family protein [Parerythrobacter sp.]
MASTVKRCAIYTRKSSEEGLEQSFNSLDAQREACEAYVLSLACEGLDALPDCYDDGFSGGNTRRPGLTALLANIAAGKIDIVNIYKIDSLTRRLANFARIVKIFDAAECSFVSVTRSFNITGERIRDMIAVSKAKGMWMGGNPPLGYDKPDDDKRILRVNEAEASIVRDMFARYLDLGSVHAMQRDLAEREIFSKQWTTEKGRTMGGKPFSRGALFHLLRNRLYLGQIVLKEQVHDGGHAAIVDQDLFDRVQKYLDSNARRHRAKASRRTDVAPLSGKLFDAAGEPMSPTTSRGESGKSYSYYVSASLQQGTKPCGRPSSNACLLPTPSVSSAKQSSAGRQWLPIRSKLCARSICRRADFRSLLRQRVLAVPLEDWPMVRQSLIAPLTIPPCCCRSHYRGVVGSGSSFQHHSAVFSPTRFSLPRFARPMRCWKPGAACR